LAQRWRWRAANAQKLFSLFSSFDGDCQSGSFLIQRNRDKLSTRKFDVGVLTQPGSKTEVAALRREGVCFEAVNGLKSDIAPCPKSADTVEKVFSG
jgi:hypothetical protein